MTDPRPRAGERLCRFDALADPGAKGFAFAAADDGSRPFRGFVVRQGEALRGYVDACPHTGGPLASEPDRYLDRSGAWILCFTHGALFNPDDGHCVAGPCAGRSLRPWDVRHEGDDVVAA